jgi:hypothetical protein
MLMGSKLINDVFPSVIESGLFAAVYVRVGKKMFR